MKCSLPQFPPQPGQFLERQSSRGGLTKRKKCVYATLVPRETLGMGSHEAEPRRVIISLWVTCEFRRLPAPHAARVVVY
ncbi:MAG: hypothetical protein GDA38_05495 [Hormoscilla sp. SP12CHS1]|nr:hypothetical protein [Hormoscilla sp. SP12CHS1]